MRLMLSILLVVSAALLHCSRAKPVEKRQADTVVKGDSGKPEDNDYDYYDYVTSPPFPPSVPDTMPVGCFVDVDVTYNVTMDGVIVEEITSTKQCCSGWSGDNCDVKPPDIGTLPTECNPSDCTPTVQPGGSVYCLMQESCGAPFPRYYDSYSDDEIECINRPQPDRCLGTCEPSPCSANCTGYTGTEDIMCFETGCDCKALWLVYRDDLIVEIDCETGLSASELQRLKRQSDDAECNP